MPLFAFEGREPQVSPGAWIAPTATLVGDVRVEAEASVWYGAVLRADFGPIVVRRGANIQDGSVLHGGDDPVTEIGEGATVGHLCVVHGAVIGQAKEWVDTNPAVYRELARRHAAGARLVRSEPWNIAH
jgi:carbonic anhydrase/acetyltransferase-like protein (isoleucine patch superfamily)